MADEELFRSALPAALEPLGLTLQLAQVDAMWQHYCLVIEANRHINLTRLTDPVKAAVKHYADSLAVAAWVQKTSQRVSTVLDIGTGAGFPAIPLAICRPDWRVTAIDGTGKKVRCVAGFIAHLGLRNCQVLHRRAEQWDENASFNLVLLRAVGPLDDCLYCGTLFCAPGSRVVCYKTDPLPPDEERAGRKAARLARLQPLTCWPYRLACGPDLFNRQLCIYEFNLRPGSP